MGSTEGELEEKAKEKRKRFRGKEKSQNQNPQKKIRIHGLREGIEKPIISGCPGWNLRKNKGHRGSDLTGIYSSCYRRKQLKPHSFTERPGQGSYGRQWKRGNPGEKKKTSGLES